MDNKTNKEIKNEIAKKASETLPQEVHSAIAKKTIADSILNQFSELQAQGQLSFPKDYPIGNQLKLIYANIVDKGLQACEPLSVANAIVETVLQGLDVSRTQCYYINYGNKCTMFRSYFGDVAVAKRTGLVKDIFAKPIYQDDEFEISSDELGRDYVVKHVSPFENRDKEIIGGWARAIMNDGTYRDCIMTKKEIESSWSMTKAKNNNQFQNNFKQEATKRTTIRRLVKMIFNTDMLTTDEQKSILASFSRSTDNEYDNKNEERRYTNVKEVKEVIDFTNKDKVENPFEDEQKEVEEKETKFDENTGEVNTEVENEVNNSDLFGYED